MAKYSLCTQEQSPLQIQLGTSSVTYAEVQEWAASTEKLVGQTSWPRFYRPSQPALGNSFVKQVECLDGLSREPETDVLVGFSTGPSVPQLGPVNAAYPIQLSFAFSPGTGILVPVSSWLVLYARTDFTPELIGSTNGSVNKGLQSWTASVVWEEF